MGEFLIAVVSETAQVLYAGSLFILLGFIIAGLLHEFLPTSLIGRHLGQENPRAVGLAVLLGAPIPLCSCGVLPAAAALREKGAGRASVLSFLISTPTTGVDSIALTYGLMGPVMAIVRPIVAVVTAMIAGLASILTPEDDANPQTSRAAVAELTNCEHATPEEPNAESAPLGERGKRALQYAFGPLIDDIAFWLLVGILLTGILSALLPDDFFPGVLGWEGGLAPMLVMIVIGVPLYLCASGSTPVAAALIAKGLSPGAALVFLTAGPATNAATIAVVGRLLGRKRLQIYLTSIILVSLGAGLLLDAVAADAILETTLSGDPSGDPWVLSMLKVIAACGFVILLIESFRRTRFRDGAEDLVQQMEAFVGAMSIVRLRKLLRPPVLAGIALVGLFAIGPSCVLIVYPGEQGIIQRFGRVVDADLDPGLYLHWPPPIEEHLVVDVDLIRQVPIGFEGPPSTQRVSISAESFYLTADENIIDIRSVIHYRVSDPVRYALGAEVSNELIRSLGRRELLAITSRLPIDGLYTTERPKTERVWAQALARRVADLDIGCEILDARLLDVHAPAAVHDAFRDVSSALEDRAREVHEASGYAAETTAEASGEAGAIVEAGRADSVRVATLASGNAAAFRGIAGVHAESPSVTETRLYLESIERSLVEPRKYIHAAGSAGGEVDLWIGTGKPTPIELATPETSRSQPVGEGERKVGE